MKWNAKMGKLWHVSTAVLGNLGLSLAIVGCDSSTAPTVTGGQIKENEMHQGKTGGAEQMNEGKMGPPSKMMPGKTDKSKKARTVTE